MSPPPNATEDPGDWATAPMPATAGTAAPGHASSGVEDPGDWVTAPHQPAPGTTARGIARNVAAGLTDAAANVGNVAVDPIGNLVGNPLATAVVTLHDVLAPYLGYKRFPDDVRQMLLGDPVPQPGTQAVKAIGHVVGVDPDAEPANTEAERLTRKVTGGAVTAGILGPGGVAAPVLGASGTLAGDVAGQVAPDWAKPGAELVGNIIGAGGASLATKGARTIAGSSGSVAPETAELAQKARYKYGIPIAAPEMSDSSFVRNTYDQSKNLPFSGAADVERATRRAWQRAVIGQMGENADLVTPQVMTDAATRIGGVFDDIAKRTSIDVDQTQLINDLGKIETEANVTPLGAGGHDDIQALNNMIVKAAADGNGVIGGEAYQALTRKGTPLDRAMSAADPNVAHYAGRIKDALDNAFQQSAPAEDQAALTTARSQWRAMKTIEDLVEKSTDGNLSPALLMGQVRNASSRFDSSTGGMAYTGGGELGDLARIGQRFLKEPPNTASGDRGWVNWAVGGLGSGLGGGGVVGAALGHPAALLPIPTGLAANRVLGYYLRSRGLADRAIDSSLAGPRPIPSPLVSGVVSDLAAERRGDIDAVMHADDIDSAISAAKRAAQ